ncbi:RNA polymerase sigma factor [Chitinophagaceae bacterium MMS25-I14]
MPELSDNTLIERLKNEEAASYKLLYKLYFPPTANYIRQNSGSSQDAEDIFQETIIVLLCKVRQPGFILTSSLKTYLFSISRNLWLKKLRADKQLIINTDGILAEEMPDFTAQQDENASRGKLPVWLQKITANCRQILKAIFYLNEPMNNLMARMGWKNKHTAANQKYKCIEQIRKESKK